MHVKRGRDEYLRVDGDGNAIGYERVQPGTCSVVMLNTDGRFDPYNTSSPLYPYILPGRKAVVTVTDNSTATTYPVIVGRLVIPRPTSGDLSTCTLEIVDALDLLEKQDIQYAVTAGSNLKDLIVLVCNMAGIPWHVTDVATDKLAYWWADRKAAQEIADLVDSSLGWFFMSASDYATFYDRYHVFTSLATITQDRIGKEILLPQPWDAVRNRVVVVAHPLTLGPDGSELWRLSDTPTIGAGETKTYLATYAYSSFPAAAYPVITPVGETDVTVNTAANGSGTDLTGSCTIGLTDYGSQGLLAITNGSASPGVITLAKIRGTPLYSPSSVAVQKDNTASQSLYQVRQLTIDSRWQENAYKAEDQANWLKNFLGNPLAFPQITVESRPGVQFAPDLFAQVPLSLSQLGISGNYLVSSIEHQWLSENGQAVLTKFGMEPAPDLSGYWRFTTQIGVTSKFAM
jgi:hypothetical protein